jgi:hypothetical protein
VRLCEEYHQRNGLPFPHARHETKGFVFFNGGSDLLSIRWSQPGPHPGSYDISECVLEDRIRSTKNSSVSWDEYEDFMLSWVSSNEGIVSSATKVFDLSWQYFIRRNDKILAKSYDPIEIYATIDEDNPIRNTSASALLATMRSKHPVEFDFWHSKASNIISRYSYWMAELKAFHTKGKP